MRRAAFILLVVLTLSCDEDDRGETPPILSAIPHTSDGEYFQDTSVNFVLDLAGSIFVHSTNWDYGDHSTGNNFQHTYTTPGTYDVRVAVNTQFGRVNGHLTIVVVEPPKILAPETSIRAIYRVGPSGYNLLTKPANSNDHRVYTLSETLLPTGSLDIDFQSSEIGPMAFTPDGKLVVALGATVTIYSNNMSLIKTVYKNKYPRDFLISDQALMILYDSASRAIVETSDLAGNVIATTRHTIEVADMDIWGGYFLNASSVAHFYRHKNGVITMVMGSGTNGEVNFSRYFNHNLALNNITPVNDGFIVNSFLTQQIPLSVSLLNSSGETVWDRLLQGRTDVNSPYQPLPIVVEELDGFYYVFFLNFRCVKIASNGSTVWDKYFHTLGSEVRDVEITSSGGFVMAGTYLGGAIVIEISAEGHAVK